MHGTRPCLTKAHPFSNCSMSKEEGGGGSFEPKEPPGFATEKTFDTKVHVILDVSFSLFSVHIKITFLLK